MDTIASALAPKIHQASMRDLANILWACARLLIQNEQMQEAIAHEVILPNCRGQDLSNLAWASATLRFKNTQMLEAIAQGAQKAPLQPQAFASIAWAFAKLRYEAAHFMEEVVGALKDSRVNFNS